MTSIVVVKDGAVGDSLLLAPAIGALRRAHPGARIEIMGSLWRLGLLAGPGLASAVVSIHAPEGTPLLDERVTAAPYFEGFDEVVVFAFEPEPAAIANLRRLVPARVAFRPHFPASGEGVHVADHVHRSLSHLGIATAADRSFELPLPAASLEWARAWLAERGLAARPGKPRVFVHPGTKIETKRWPAERFAEVLGRLASRGFEILLDRGPMDFETNQPIEDALRGTRTHVVVGANLVQTAGLLARSSLYLGVDSGITHLAALLGRPTVAIYGATRPVMWGPIGRRVRVVSGSLGLPCCASDHPRDCRGGCVAAVSAGAALAAVDEILEI